MRPDKTREFEAKVKIDAEGWRRRALAGQSPGTPKHGPPGEPPTRCAKPLEHDPDCDCWTVMA